MDDSVLTVEVDKVIRRPLEVVSRQFGDMRHHEKDHVHAGIEFEVISEDGGACHLRQHARMLGMTQDDEVVQIRQTNGDLMSEVIAGSNRGMRMRQSFAPATDGATAVHMRVDIPVAGVKKLLKPLFAVAVRRVVEQELEENRIDLEERGYPPLQNAA